MEKVSYKLLKALYKGDMDIDSINKLTEHKDTNKPNPYTIYLKSDKMANYYTVGAKADGEGGVVDGVEWWKITLTGRDYIERRLHDKLNFWLPYTITTILAIASLVISILGRYQAAN